GGAEADYYLGLDPPHPITNGPMTSVSELSLIKGMTPDIYERLLPLVIALPEDVKMNINTLKPELLRALNRKDILQPLEEAEWRALVDERAAALEGYTDVNAFLGAPVASALFGDNSQFDAAHLVTAAHY